MHSSLRQHINGHDHVPAVVAKKTEPIPE